MPECLPGRRAVVMGAATLAGVAATSRIWPRIKWGAGSEGPLDPGPARSLRRAVGEEPFRLTVAQADITPGSGVPMAGYGYGPRLSDGRCERRLLAQCAVLRDPRGRALTLVRVDAGGLTYEGYRSIVDTLVAEGTVATPADFMINVSHTHSGPALGLHPDPRVLTHLPEAGLEGVKATVEAFRSKVIDVVRAAHRAEPVPVLLSYAVGRAEVGVVRWVRERTGPTELPVLVARNAGSGKIEAIVYSYPCHPVCRGNDTVLDADFCGLSSSLISAELGAPALFLQGTAGDVDPIAAGGEGPAAAGEGPAANANGGLAAVGEGPGASGRAAARGTEARVQLVGRSLAGAVVRTVRESRFTWVKGGLDAAISSVDLPFAVDLSNPGDIAELRRRYRERVTRLRPGPTRAGAARRHAELMVRLIDGGSLPRGIGMTAQVWQLGGLRLVALAHEVVGDYTGFVRGLAGSGDVWVLGYTNHVECYLPSDAGLRAGGYAAGWSEGSGRHLPDEAGSVTVYGWPAPLRSTLDAKPGEPGVEETVLRHVGRLLGRA